MSVYSGPDIVRDGLTFHYDTNNTKSWKGKPTTNYYSHSFPNYNNWNNQDVVAEYPEPGVTRLYSTSRVAFSAISSPGGSYGANANTNALLSYSILARGIGTAYVSAHQASTTPNSSVHTSVSGASAVLSPNSWTKLTRTNFYHVNNVTAQNLLVNLNAGANNYVEIKEPQIEFNEFVTQYTKTSRSTTNALVDLTKNTTVTMNTGIQYNSDQTYTHVPATDTSSIILPLSTSLNKLTGSINVWVYPYGYEYSTGIFVNRDSSLANALDWLWLGTWSSGGTFYFRTGNGSGCCSQDLTISSFSTLCPTNNWHNICVTWESEGPAAIYVNGVSRATRTLGVIPNTNPSSTGRIGLGHTGTNSTGSWNGKIEVFSIYNKALNSDEVKENFEALRGRFGV